MKKLLFILLGIIIVSAGVVFALNNKTNVNADTPANKNILVAYFSATGRTKQVAQNLAKATGGDLYEIKPEKPYTSADFDWNDSNSRTSTEKNNPHIRPAIIADNFSLKDYDTIFLGFPIWWGSAPNIIHTFLEKYDFSNKKIIIFATSGSSGLGNTAADLKPSVSKSAEIIEGDVLNSNPSVEYLEQWVKKF